MDPALFSLISGGIVCLFLFLIAVVRRSRRNAGSYRAGVLGATFELHARERQKAIEIILENKAAARRPEYPGGNLPELEKPDAKPSGEPDGRP
jgi:hypothetical protein